jgi:hypothetical protein
VNRHDEPEIQRQRAALVALAEAMLRGEVGVVEAAPRIITHGRRGGLEDDDADIRIFEMISSLTDHLPTGSARRYWNAEALARKDVEIAEAEVFHRPPALAACESLLRRLRTQ